MERALLKALPSDFIDRAREGAGIEKEQTTMLEKLLNKGKVVTSKFRGSVGIVVARQSTENGDVNSQKHEILLETALSVAVARGIKDPDYICVANFSGSFGVDLCLALMERGYKHIFFEDIIHFSTNFDRGVYVLDKAFLSGVQIYTSGDDMTQGNGYALAVIQLMLAEIRTGTRLPSVGRRRVEFIIRFLKREISYSALKADERRFINAMQYVGVHKFVTMTLKQLRKKPENEELALALAEAYRCIAS